MAAAERLGLVAVVVAAGVDISALPWSCEALVIRGACAEGRKVKLLHRPTNQKERWSVIAKPRTNGSGKWTYLVKKNSNGDRYATAGNYHVKVGETRVNAGGREITCKEKFSSSMLVG